MIMGAWPRSYWLFVLIPAALIVLPNLGPTSLPRTAISVIGFVCLTVLCFVVSHQAEREFRLLALTTAIPCLTLSIIGIVLQIRHQQFSDRAATARKSDASHN
jgi:hypothetical protein